LLGVGTLAQGSFMIIKNDTVEEAAGRALVRELQSAHFYTPQGDPRYYREDGKPVTLREARKENLFPSITHIMNIMENRPLTIYKEKQLLVASYNMRPRQDEQMDDYFSRVISQAREDGKQAARVGTDTHSGIESILKGERWDKENALLQKANEWIEDNVQLVHWLEGNLVDESIGLAGRCDAFLRLKDVGNAVVDWKTRRFKELKSGWKVQWYKKDVRQISFYAGCVERALERVGIPGDVAAINIALNTCEPSPVAVKSWSQDERQTALEMVECINDLWQDENKYHPHGLAHYYLGIEMPPAGGEINPNEIGMED